MTYEEMMTTLRNLYNEDTEEFAYERGTLHFQTWMGVITECTVSIMNLLEYGLPLDIEAERGFFMMVNDFRSIDFDRCLINALSWWDSVKGAKS